MAGGITSISSYRSDIVVSLGIAVQMMIRLFSALQYCTIRDDLKLDERLVPSGRVVTVSESFVIIKSPRIK